MVARRALLPRAPSHLALPKKPTGVSLLQGAHVECGFIQHVTWASLHVGVPRPNAGRRPWVICVLAPVVPHFDQGEHQAPHNHQSTSLRAWCARVFPPCGTASFRRRSGCPSLAIQAPVHCPSRWAPAVSCPTVPRGSGTAASSAATVG